MANTTAVYARIDTELKENAEGILAKLGITPSGAIQMLYSQIVLHDGLPFELRLPEKKPTAIGGMTEEEISAEIQKGFDSFKDGKGYTPEEVDNILKDKYGI
ncbi:MAG: type II toxin-antitoxin system RelB/DinJ family antitoxin [Oscillospiraceae bacterium]|nr:type II toxin-antitoxin system RelB/DinJ family antitoxin [Oscillospiraceae bacterium]